jgi:hypothetical protein
LLFTTTDNSHVINVTVAGNSDIQLAGFRFSTPNTIVIDNWSIASKPSLYSNSIDLFTGNDYIRWSASSDLFVYIINPFDVYQASSLLNKIQTNIVNPIRSYHNNAVDFIVIVPPVQTFDSQSYSLFPSGFTDAQLTAWNSFVSSLLIWAPTLNIAVVDMGQLLRSYTTVFMDSTALAAIDTMVFYDYLGNQNNTDAIGGNQYPFLSARGHFFYSEVIAPLLTNSYNR